MLYAASKKLDSFSQRMNDAVGGAIDSINRADQRAGVSAKLKQSAQPITDKLDNFSVEMTRKAESLQEKAGSRRNSNPAEASRDSRSGSFQSGRTTSGDAAAKPSSRRSSGRFGSIGDGDRAPSAADSGSDSDSALPNRESSPVPSSALRVGAAASASNGDGGAQDGFDTLAATRHKSSSFSYNPQSSHGAGSGGAGGASKMNARSRGNSGGPSIMPIQPPPPLQPALSFSGGLPADPASSAADDHHPHAPSSHPDSPISNRSSRSNSISFSQLALGDVDLGGGNANGAHQVNSPFSPGAGDQGLLH
jgi:hypothetical protein